MTETPRELLLDTNVLLFRLGGLLFGERLTKQGPRAVRHFDPALRVGFERYVAQARRHVTLPHVLTETSNLLTADSNPTLRTGVLRIIQQVLRGGVDELPVGSRLSDDVPDHIYSRLGLTDAVIFGEATGRTVVTEDSALRAVLHGRARAALSLRQAARFGLGR